MKKQAHRFVHASWGRALLATALVGMIGLAPAAPPAAAPEALPRFLAAPLPIDCDDTPFGKHAPMAQDSEGMSLFATNGLVAIDEYRPPVGAEQPPFVRVYRSDLLQAGLTGGQFQRAVSLDFNGDGRDEVVAAYRMPDGSLKLGVYQRGAPAGASLFDTWSMAQPFTQVELAAGDLDGSTDGGQELAVLLRTPSGGVRVFVLDGDASGGIAEMNGSQAGLWQRPGPYNTVALAVGDLLLDRHDQLVLVADSGFGQSRVLNYELMEYKPLDPHPHLPIDPGDSGIGSTAFSSPLDVFEPGPGVDSVLKIDADAGDLVDGAAAELVVHVQFKQSEYDYIGQRLVHFTITRDENDAIAGVDLYHRSPAQAFDASRLIQNQNENGLASFEATIANVDARAPGEIVLARSVPGGELRVSAYKLAVDRMAGFTFITNNRTANFRNTSTGEPTSYLWKFGDNSGEIHAANPSHTFAGDGTYTVTLTATYADDSTRTYSHPVSIGGVPDEGGIESVWQYHFEDTAYEASYAVADINDLSFVNVAAGDMDRDGTVDVLTTARNTTGVVLRSRWWLHDVDDPGSFAGEHQSESNSTFNGMAAMDLVASDFDGDSLHGVLGDDCRQVTEPQVRQVVWLPPYFSVLQAGAEKKSSWGQSTSGTSSSETRSGSYVSHDVSGYIGVEVGTPDNLPYTIEASVAVTAGRNWQAGHGQVHAEDSTQTVDEGKEISTGEALVMLEKNSFDCYAYDVFRAAGGLDPDSEMRMCAQVKDSRGTSGTDAVSWDTLPAQTINDPAIGHKPAQWFPLHRDWSSLALFHGVSSNTAFVATGKADNATDGLFATEAQSGGSSPQPYLQIDLGQVRDISNVRVFPAAGQAAHLTGFRLYASRTPMNGNGLPTGAGVTTYVQETGDNASYDRWNIWTRNPAQPSRFLRARYIRLQHPGSATLRIAEVQVFGDPHLDPPAYPQAVCDQVADDGVFSALVWNPQAAKFEAIDVRGKLLWSGAGAWPAPGPNDDYPACTNNADVAMQPIWANVLVGDSATNTWNMSQTQGSLNGTTRSFDNATRVGAAFDFKAGFIAKVIGGAAYEFTKGITQEVQNSSYWSTGLDMGGAVGGFDADYAGDIDACKYRPRPYAYHQSDRSDAGYRHDVYTVDYVVQEGPGRWKRAAVPGVCYGDRIFADGFEG